jgi:hypothetical protein
MSLNPITVIKDALDSVPLKYRKVVYTAIALGVVGYGLWEASEGNWGILIGSVVTALGSAMSLIKASDGPKVEEDMKVDDGSEIPAELQTLIGGDNVQDALAPIV